MALHKDVQIGHIHLTVSDLDRSLAFYRDLLGFEVTTTYGNSAVFLSAGGYHHHIALNTWAGKGAHPAPPGHAGLYHAAILFPNRKELAHVVKRLVLAHYPLTGSADHGVSEAIYVNDPDGNGIELYVDRPRESWMYESDGSIHMETEPLDIDSLMAEAD